MTQDEFIRMCDGNPGCLTFMVEASHVDDRKATWAFDRMCYLGIKGSKLYMLWNDCCDRDTAFALRIMLNNSADDIIEHINYEGGRGIPYNGKGIMNKHIAPKISAGPSLRIQFSDSILDKTE